VKVKDGECVDFTKDGVPHPDKRFEDAVALVEFVKNLPPKEVRSQEVEVLLATMEKVQFCNDASTVYVADSVHVQRNLPQEVGFMMTREEVYKLIDGERNYQDVRWHDDDSGHGTHVHSWEEWFMYIEDYIGEAKHIISRESAPACYARASDIMRKVAAMAVCAMEQNGAKPRPGYERVDAVDVVDMKGILGL